MAPRANLAGATYTGVGQDVNVNGAGVFVRATRMSFLTNGEGRVQQVRAVLLVVRVGLVSAQLVNVYQGAVVKRTSDCPCDSASSKTFACRFRSPCFVQVNGDRELSTAVVPVLLRRVYRGLSDLAHHAQALRASVGRTSVVSSANEVNRFKASTGDYFASDRLGLVRVAGSVMNLTYLFGLSRVFANVPLVGVRRDSLLVNDDQVIMWFSRRPM